MSEEERGLIDALYEDPYDELALAAYADLLEERGEEKRAEEVRHDQLPYVALSADVVRGQLGPLLADLWSLDGKLELTLRRGFVDGVITGKNEWAEVGPRLTHKHPLRWVRFRDILPHRIGLTEWVLRRGSGTKDVPVYLWGEPGHDRMVFDGKYEAMAALTQWAIAWARGLRGERC